MAIRGLWKKAVKKDHLDDSVVDASKIAPDVDVSNKGFNSAKLLGFGASQTAGANLIPVSQADGKLNSAWLPPATAELTFDQKKLIVISTVGGWTSSHLGSGFTNMYAFELAVRTGATANSRALVWASSSFFNSGDAWWANVDYGKKLEWYLNICRANADIESIGRIQLKEVTSEGALTGAGIGLEISNFTVIGEAYGTVRGVTGTLTTLSNTFSQRIKIVHIPGTKVDFYVGGVLVASLTGTAVPSGIVSGHIVFSIINGATGGVDCILRIGSPVILQEW